MINHLTRRTKGLEQISEEVRGWSEVVEDIREI